MTTPATRSTSPLSNLTLKRNSVGNQEHVLSPTCQYPCHPSATVAALDEIGLLSDESAKLIIVMVGLPARGKSYVTKKLCRYLNWLQIETKIFNVGDRRRTIGQCSKLASPNGQQHVSTAAPSVELNDHSADFFDPGNGQAKRLREKAALETLEELLDYLIDSGGRIGLFDATNSTIERRDLIVQKVGERAPELGLMFLESQCFDKKLLESNIRLKLSGPDYKNKDQISALADFRNRIAMYEKTYEPLGEFEERNGYPYCQILDVGRKFVTHNISGFLATQAVHYLQHFNLLPRQIWLTRHGDSFDDAAGRIGGDAELTPSGIRYAAALSRFIAQQREEWEILHAGGADRLKQYNFCDTLQRSSPGNRVPKKFHVWTSTMRRSMQTAGFFNAQEYQPKHWRMLDELNAGVLEGLTREQVKDFYSDWYHMRQKDKFLCRYPGTAGEGYLDVTNRLKSVILEVERVTDHVLLVSGLAVTRLLLAYFKGLHRDEIVDLHVPLGALHMLEPKPYGVHHQSYVYNAETDWFELSF